MRRMPIVSAAAIAAALIAWGAARSGHARIGDGMAPVPAVMSYRAQVLRVVDGDTLHARVAVWPGHMVETRVRLAGVDAPELRGRCRAEKERAIKARRALMAQIDGRNVILVHVRADKYFGRVVAEVHADGRDVGAALMAAGHAAPYGRGRPDWCGRSSGTGSDK